MSHDISNKLTSIGRRYMYQKLFDESSTYNKAFYEDSNTLLKLRLYQDESSYIESARESVMIDDDYIKLSYEFDQDNISISSIALYNGDVPTMIFDELQLQSITQSGTYNKLINIELIFRLVDETLCIPTEARRYILESLINQNNIKITKMYLGKGDPDLSGDKSRLTRYLSSYEFTIQYLDDSVKLTAFSNDDKLIYNNITEIGLGYTIDYGDSEVIINNYDKDSQTDNTDGYLDLEDYIKGAIVSDRFSDPEHNYMLYTIQSTNLSKMGSAGKYMIDFILRLF